jgi:hypothetical protein
MHLLLIIIMLAQGTGASSKPSTPGVPAEDPNNPSAYEKSLPDSPEEAVVKRLVLLISNSGRATSAAETATQRVAVTPQIAPGAPPLLSFRYFEGKQRHRYGKLDLVMDDAGH